MTGGVIAAARRTSAPPASPLLGLGQSVSGSATNLTTFPVTLPTISGGILANDLIVIWVTLTRGSVTYSEMAAAGYTQIYQVSGASASIFTAIGCFAKVAAGGETTASVTATVSAVHTVLARVYRNAVGLPAVVTALYSGTGSGTYDSNTVNVEKETDLVVTQVGGRGPASGNPAAVWGGGAVSSYGTATGRVGYLVMADQTGVTGDVTHNVTTTNTQGGPSTMRGSIVIKSAA